MVRGIALNGWSTFGDSTVHVRDSTGALRAIRVAGSPVATGDSVRVLGRSAQLQGDRVLTDATIFVVGSAAEPLPIPLPTADAATARTGNLAAELVSVSKARVLDARQLASGDVRLQVDDGSGVLEVLIDRHAGITSDEPILVGAQVEVTGVLVPLTSGRWQLKPRSTADFEVRIPTATIAAARALPPGQVIAIEGVALNAWATFGDGSVHMADSTGTIRVFEPSTSVIAAGDSLRFVGIIQLSSGQPILASADVTHRGLSHWVPNPIRVFSAVAATADGGALDATLVEVTGAVVDSVKTVASETHLIIDDGTGQVTVVLDRDTGISGGGYAVDDAIEVVGMLVPTASGTWLLKPRSSSDLRKP
jgi:DNA/RNA endonuclease YhcR with UshA esterase domain